MMFAVDVHENRRQRSQMGDFIKLCGIIKPRDWVLSTHLSGGFYRYVSEAAEWERLGFLIRSYQSARSHD